MTTFNDWPNSGWAEPHDHDGPFSSDCSKCKAEWLDERTDHYAADLGTRHGREAAEIEWQDMFD